MEFSLHHKQLQQQMMSPSQIQSLEILAMDSAQLNQFLKNEYLENPLLECSEYTEPTGHRQPPDSFYGQLGACGRPAPETGDSFSSSDEFSNPLRDLSAPDPSHLRSYLLGQLDIRQYSQQEWELFIYLIDCLDDSGFFTVPAEEVVAKTGCSLRQVESTLTCLRQLEPYGIFADSLSSSLLRQLEAKNAATPLLSSVILYHLQDVAEGRISTISRSLSVSTSEVRKCIHTISGLNPRPLMGFGQENSSYLIPDILLQKEAGRWSVHLNDSWVEDYRPNDYYLRMMEQSRDQELIDYFKGKLQRVQLILAGVRKRRNTLLTVSQSILDIQRPFFEGEAPLTPMTMEEVAKRSHIHASTVSRAVRNKYLQYPGGSLPVRELFTPSVAESAKGTVGPAQIKLLIRQFIASEDPAKPYSDRALADLLKDWGISVSRRVIAKYREELGIRGSFYRK
ncbi:MAG: RNA polymerase factor sigma-54 [Lachnospiraceae bacterium]|nr:RNA polymerase factor sigma-54 [Lachnospiraceae bacterium]